MGGRAGRTQLFSLWQTTFSTFSSPWWLSFEGALFPNPSDGWRMLGLSSWEMLLLRCFLKQNTLSFLKLYLSGNERIGNRWFSDKHNYFTKFPEEQTHPVSIMRHPINATDVVFSVKEKSSVQIRIRMLVSVSFCWSVCRCCWVAHVPLWPLLQMLILSNHHLRFLSSICHPPHGGGEGDSTFRWVCMQESANISVIHDFRIKTSHIT